MAVLSTTLAPHGRLRAAINFGNPVLAQRDPQGEPAGVTVALARELGARLGVPVELVPFDAAGKVVAAATTDAWDVAFLANDPARAAEIVFSAPYVQIEGTYLVRDDAPLRAIDEVDRAGIRVTVGRGSAYDLYLSRALTRAEIVRFASFAEAMEAFARDGLEVAAGVRQPLDAFAAARPGHRVMPGRFMVIEQTVALPKTRAAGAPYVHAFVEEMKANGFVADALAASDQRDAIVAPAAQESTSS